MKSSADREQRTKNRGQKQFFIANSHHVIFKILVSYVGKCTIHKKKNSQHSQQRLEYTELQ